MVNGGDKRRTRRGGGAAVARCGENREEMPRDREKK